MRLAILSDIHGNLEAFQAVLADLEGQGADELLGLGDLVGYGPDPEDVVRLARQMGVRSVMGNHELGLSDPACLAWFNPQARHSLELTRAMLSDESLAYLADLPRWRAAHGCRLVHGFPPDSPTTYLFEADEARVAQVMEELPERICFVGHTHELGLMSVRQGRVRVRPLRQGEVMLEHEGRHLVNAGSVGQPRDGDNRAKYLLYEPDTGRLELRRVAYDIAAVAAKITARGLPEANARRLW